MASGFGPLISRPSRLRSHRSSTASTGSGSGAEYSSSGDEILLENYFTNLAAFRFDHAREICDKERDRITSPRSDNWCSFLAVLSRLASADANYFSLAFITERNARVRLLRKETLKTQYEFIILELKKIQDIYSQRRGGMDFSWERKLTDLLNHIVEYVSARKELMDFYTSFDNSDGCLLDYARLEGVVKKMNSSFKDNFQHSLLRSLKITFQKELGVLGDLLLAQRHMSEWQFLSAILIIQSCNKKFSDWLGVIPIGLSDSLERQQMKKSIRSRPQSPPTPSFIPYLYKWWCKFHVVLLSKFTLYFHGVLAEHASVYDMKYLSEKLEIHYIAKFYSLVRNTNAACACLVFDSNGLKDFKGPKYYFPGSPLPPLSGISSYPVMVHAPQDFEFLHHRPNIVSIIMSKSHQLSSSSQFIQQHDEKVRSTYYMGQVEQRVTLVVIVGSSSARGGRDKDSKILSWMSDIAHLLRNTDLANSLKPT